MLRTEKTNRIDQNSRPVELVGLVASLLQCYAMISLARSANAMAMMPGASDYVEFRSVIQVPALLSLVAMVGSVISLVRCVWTQFRYWGAAFSGCCVVMGWYALFLTGWLLGRPPTDVQSYHGPLLAIWTIAVGGAFVCLLHAQHTQVPRREYRVVLIVGIVLVAGALIVGERRIAEVSARVNRSLSFSTTGESLDEAQEAMLYAMEHVDAETKFSELLVARQYLADYLAVTPDELHEFAVDEFETLPLLVRVKQQGRSWDWLRFVGGYDGDTAELRQIPISVARPPREAWPTLHLTGDGDQLRVMWEEVTLPLGDLRSLLGARCDHAGIHVTASANVTCGEAVQLFDLIREAGVSKVGVW